MIIRTETMGDFFVKYHLDSIPGSPVVHAFSATDNGDPHDHPWGFVSFVLHGGYDEEVFDTETGKSQIVQRRKGDRFEVSADHVHRLVHLPEGECYTVILPGEHRQTPGFWQFRENGIFRRDWNGQWWRQ